MFESAVTRYRPTVIALSTIAACLTIYYVHRSIDHPLSGLRRSNAVHRRRRSRPSRVETAQDSNSSFPRMNAAELINILDLEFSRENDYDIDLDSVRSIDLNNNVNERPTIRFRSNEVPMRQYLRNVERYERGSTERKQYEEAFLRAFLDARVPVRTLLIDPQGHDEFVLRLQGPSGLENNYFSDRDAILATVISFNMRRIDLSSETQRFLSNLPTPRSSMPQTDSPELREFLAEASSHRTMVGTLNTGEVDAGNHGNHDASILQESRQFDMSLESSIVTIDSSSSQIMAEEDEAEETQKDGQSLLNMLYHIAQDQSRRDGYIHRGVACNICGVSPIKGVRYRCSNCPDYDLCEQCESMQLHPMTHLFYKIRIPAPFFNSTRHPQTPKYPGRPTNLPNHLPKDIAKDLSKESGREPAEVEALWEQFKCLAATEWPEDPLEFRMAINRKVFDQCFLPGPLKCRKPPNLPIHDRIFAFFDTDANGLIGLSEFVMGVATIRTKDKDLSLRRIFDCYDMDGDGYVRRKDFLRLFWSYYTLMKDFTEDALMSMDDDIMEGEALRETLRGSQPISATFTGSVPNSQHHPTTSGKRFDMISQNNNIDALFTSTLGLGGKTEIIGDFVENEEYGSVLDVSLLAPVYEGKEGDHPIAKMDWPPSFLQQAESDTASDITGLKIENVTDIHDKLKILNAVASCRRRVRLGAVKERQEHRQFYEHRGNPRSNGHAAGVDSSRPMNEKCAETYENTDERLATPLEADAGQEYLYQVLEESMNELLDPLFKLKEDLYIEALFCSEEMEQLNGPEFAFFNTENFRELCTCDVSSFLRSVNDSPIGDEMNLDVHEALTRWIEKRANSSEDSYVQNMIHLEKHKIISTEESQERIRRSQRQSDAESDSDQSSSSVADDSQPGLSSDDPRELHNVVKRIAREVDERDAARANLAREIGGELSRAVEQFGGSSDSLERSIAELPLGDLLAESGYSIVEDVTEVDSHSGSYPVIHNTVHHENRASIRDEASGTTATTATAGIMIESSDPTLPHKRPHKASARLEQIPHIAPLDESEPQQFVEKRKRWTYLIILDCLIQQDKRRGGPGCLNFEEFENIMNSRRGIDITFLGMFYDMILF